MQRLREICNKMLALAEDEGSVNSKSRIFELTCMLDLAINELEQERAEMNFDPFPAFSIDRTALSIERPGRYEWAE